MKCAHDAVQGDTRGKDLFDFKVPVLTWAAVAGKQSVENTAILQQKLFHNVMGHPVQGCMGIVQPDRAEGKGQRGINDPIS